MCNSAVAEYIEPSNIQIQTEKYPVELETFESAKYLYEISWQGIKVGSASFEVDAEGSEQNSEAIVQNKNLVAIKAEAKSAKLIDVFYRLRHESESLVEKKTMQPVKFSTWQKENSKIKSAELNFGKDSRIQGTTEKDGKIEKENDFKSHNFTLDPISAAFFARSIPIEVGTKASFDVFNGKHRYLITFNVTAIEEIEIMGKLRKAFKAVPSVQKLTDTEGEKRLQAASIWISADETREILKLESKVFVGSVNATLVKVENSEKKVNLASVGIR